MNGLGDIEGEREREEGRGERGVGTCPQNLGNVLERALSQPRFNI